MRLSIRNSKSACAIYLWTIRAATHFIDEFQDTSEMQWQNLIPLIDNALAGQDDYGERNFDDCGRS
jgi:hypothetical protein